MPSPPSGVTFLGACRIEEQEARYVRTKGYSRHPEPRPELPEMGQRVPW